MQWSQAALRAFPSIAEACQAVEQRNGKTYVRLEGEVEDVRDGGKRIRVDFEDGNELTFTPTPRTALYIDGERTPFEELRDGTELNFYIPEDRLQAELQPDPERLAYIIVPLDITVTRIASRAQPAAGPQGAAERGSMAANDELPATAGPLPLLAFGGGMLLAVGAFATIRRKWRGG